jgi:hypothetical protein
LVLWRDLRDDRPRTPAGTFAASDDALPAQWRRTVLVPGTRYDVAAAVRADVTDDPEVHARQAPDDGTFVALSIAVSPRPGPYTPDDARRGTEATVDPRFTLVADGRRYALPEPVGEPAPMPRGVATPTRLPVNGWLAVAGGAGRLSLETSWQGRVQSVDLRSGDRVPGDFAVVYRQRSVGTVPAVYRQRSAGTLPVARTSCGTAVWTPGWRAGPGIPAACAYRVDRLAWTPGEGWAKPGRQWLALTTRTSVPTYQIHQVGGQVRRYRPSYYGDSSAQSREASEAPDRLDGARPVGLQDVDSAVGEDHTVVLIFDVARTAGAHAAVVTQSFRAVSRSGHLGGYAGPVRQTWTFRVA